MQKFLNKKTILEIIRFLIVGSVATLVDYFMTGLYEFMVLKDEFNHFYDVFFRIDFPTHVVLKATTLGFLSGLIVNYFLSIIFVYDELGNSKSKKGFIVFAILSLIGLLISNIGMYLGYDLLNINQWIVKILVTGVVLIYNYISKRLIIFRKGELHA